MGSRSLSFVSRVQSALTIGHSFSFILQMSSKDNQRVRLGKVAVTLALLVVGLTVTLVTYLFLLEEEYNNFETAVRNLTTLP